MEINKSTISGCYEIIPKVLKDERGVFVKTFNNETFAEHNLETNFAEQYYSFSHRGVLRGLHFQTPPRDHNKLVYSVSGAVMDVVVDLRIGSSTYGKYEVFELSADKGNMIYIPTGLAHGFCVRSEYAILVYNVSTVYSPPNDSGIHWDSLDIPWPEQSLIISKRDSEFVPFSDFASPFIYKEG